MICGFILLFMIRSIMRTLLGMCGLWYVASGRWFESKSYVYLTLLKWIGWNSDACEWKWIDGCTFWSMGWALTLSLCLKLDFTYDRKSCRALCMTYFGWLCTSISPILYELIHWLVQRGRRYSSSSELGKTRRVQLGSLLCVEPVEQQKTLLNWTF